MANAEAPKTSSLGLPVMSIPKENPQTPEKIALGRKLFFDKRLSANGEISCASCHQQERAFADHVPLAKGIRGGIGTRNSPSLLNAAFSESQFWDGRRQSLEAQGADPFVNPREHGLSNYDELLNRIRADNEYPRRFKQVFKLKGNDIGLTQVTQSLASFIRSLAVGNSSFDQFYYAGKKDVLPEAARRGFELFRGRAQCVACHTISEHGASFTDNQFHSLGVGLEQISKNLAALTTRVAATPASELDRLITTEPDIAALGRFVVTHNPNDIGRFKTPSLRNVALTAPYMHDGSVATLEEAVDQEVYYRGLEAGRPLILTPSEKADVIAFLNALTSAQ